ncbi:hypothetical protein ACP3T3_15760 [Chryseobacterium sp. CBSDS_008]|uniref:hypothetical protein n=1 Tax=Chryseobacterium sp. CBSDS_008 TaxID=3415265 RepID=UPI003CEA7864
MKRIFTFIALAIGIVIMFFFDKDGESSNLMKLIFLLIFSVPLVKILFPETKKLGIGTDEFYSNLLKKFKRK